jgi:peroxiredoxin
MGTKVSVGDRITGRRLVAITGAEVPIPDPDQLVHLQFRRFAGCPFCNLHLRAIASRHEQIRAAAVREVVVFHSTAEDLLAYHEEMPFPVVADPDKRLYREFGVEASARAALDPRAWYPALRGVIRKRGRMAADYGSGLLGLPADLLIAPDGRVVGRKYGAHAYDQWSVDELLEIVRQATRTTGSGPAS